MFVSQIPSDCSCPQAHASYPRVGKQVLYRCRDDRLLVYQYFPRVGSIPNGVGATLLVVLVISANLVTDGALPAVDEELINRMCCTGVIVYLAICSTS